MPALRELVLWAEMLWLLQLLWIGVSLVSQCSIVIFSLLFAEGNKGSAPEGVSHMLECSSAMIAINVGKTMLFLDVTFSIIIHLGLNPNTGGRLPIDNRMMRIRVVMIVILWHACDTDNLAVVELVMDTLNMVEVKIT